MSFVPIRPDIMTHKMSIKSIEENVWLTMQATACYLLKAIQALSQETPSKLV